MSDSLGNGRGSPTEAQIRLYERWAEGGSAASIIGEVQISPDYAEKPGNLVLCPDSETTDFRQLAQRGSANGAQLWLQLGHAGAMAHPPISKPKGPSALNVDGLQCAALSFNELRRLPSQFAQAAKLAQDLGFGGVQIHAAHGFLLSQFLSPLFNKRDDEYGGNIESRMRILINVVDEVRNAVDPSFVVAVKLNSTDQLLGGLMEDDALEVVLALDSTGIDLIDISGGTYFPGATSASDAVGSGPYFIGFAQRARQVTTKPLMLTGGFKTKAQMVAAINDGYTDVVGLARALVLDPESPNKWHSSSSVDPEYPRFASPPAGGITAWYTLRMSELGQDTEPTNVPNLESALRDYEERDRQRVFSWKERFE